MPERLTRVQRRQRQTQERIFRVAMALFREKGFEHTTIAEIAEAADIGKGTFFTYYPSKEAIFAHLGAMLTDAMAETVTQAQQAGTPATQVLEGLFAAAAAWHEANRPLSEQVILASLRTGFVMEADAPNRQRMLEIVAKAVQDGQARGELKATVTPQDAATALVGVYFATMLAWVQEPEGRPLSQRLQTALILLLEGLRS